MGTRKSAPRSPIIHANPYRNENADISFSAGIVLAVQLVRAHVAILPTRDEVNEYAPGAIHALRKLCEGERPSGHIYKVEVEEWRDLTLQWLDRVEEKIPPNLRAEYRAHLEEDFRVILTAAGGMLFSRREANMRYLPVPFDSEEALRAARAAAERKHPVRLGSALHEYLKECIRKLLAES
jgi:hypothetical protein